MHKQLTKSLPIIFMILHCFNGLYAQNVLDSFDSTSGWKIIASDAVSIDTAITDGYDGKCIKFDYEFTAGTGYCGIQKQFPTELPENYEFSFYLKADAEINNLEFKILDRSGDNVWWRIFRNYEFPRIWQKITIKKRDIDFAWGPVEDRSLSSFDKVEFIVSSVTGGKGTIFIDELVFLNKPEPVKPTANPLLTVSSAHKSAHFMMDDDGRTAWKSALQPDSQRIDIDLKQVSEFGGLIIVWDQDDYARIYDILLSDDGVTWEIVYKVTHGKGGRSYVYLKDSEARYLRLRLHESSHGQGYSIRELTIKDIDFSESPEKFFAHIAADHPRGYYPRYLYNEQSYWTIVGVTGDRDEALINEEGMVEVDKGCFSIEPFLYYRDHLITWNDVHTQQYLVDDYLPIPSVLRVNEDLQLEAKAFAHGEADHSVLYLIYTIKNVTDYHLAGDLYLAIRPFQVNPPWQFLNWPGGTAKIESIEFTDQFIRINDDKKIYCLSQPDGFGASEFDQGDISTYLARNTLPERQGLSDHFGYASGALGYHFDLEPAESHVVYLAIPFHDDVPPLSAETITTGMYEVTQFWESTLNAVRFNLPPSADRLIHSIRSNLAYILINQDYAGIQPGSRSYERSWIRDGSMTSTALLKLGIQDAARNFYEWYSRYQYDNGKIPCVVDFRGPDPVPENDSNGQFIYGIYQYFKFTHDTTYLRGKFDQVKKAIDYLDYLVSQRSTDYFAQGDDEVRAFYGILPESISHEGYSAKPMHSYWDNFWAIRGYKDAVEIANVLKENVYIDRFTASRDRFRVNLYQSIDLAVKNRGIDYIPGCVELGDFDATSTAIAVYPCLELENLPARLLGNTFSRYDEFFAQRLDSSYEWNNYTPYEIRLAAAYLVMGGAERAHRMLNFFYSDQRPHPWNHWAEVVWRDARRPEFIGDMPHTWVGSEFITAARLMFVLEDEANNSLLIGQGLKREWLDSPEGIEIANLPTHYGIVNYSIIKNDGGYHVELSGDLVMPAGKIKLRNLRDISPRQVVINGKPCTEVEGSYIVISEFPAVVEVYY
ncbi:discoidin domain-containing protein [candidate division KSB1 bacterium]|nr:discoidin domain-containing protein [candidate division KSB1 bacterium]